ncbi:DUF1254 domain-containing protein [Pseudomonas sp. ADAK13]|uniref:DUF1254 domain-containing protein n=1 Tax=Pseudomonas sp. ADAK13 TaxID=2730847 RepID=UPI0015B6E260|nr:DUF1254 domain-containing protein [Pseudomonas sp. ADAK13]
MTITARLLLATTLAMGSVDASLAAPIGVTPDNFVRAESDLYFSRVVRDGGFAKFKHSREFPAIDKQIIIRLNRDTLYSSAVVDMDAGPVVLNVPHAHGRFLSVQVINEDHYTAALLHEPGRYTLTRQDMGTRYALIGVRILVDPKNPADMTAVHALQDQLSLEQAQPGTFSIPDWNHRSQDEIRQHLLALAAKLPDTRGMFGTQEQVNPVRHLLGSAFGWGGNPDTEATYLNVSVAHNDGKTPYVLDIKDVPVKGFWSISVYDKNGYFKKNALQTYTLNSIGAARQADGTVRVRFGGCGATTSNCIPITDGWNYMVRLYLPSPEILDASWSFPTARIAREATPHTP